MARPDKPLISRERAARAALDVIDTQGLTGLNLETVARRIGVKAPSLYYHFKDKSELLSEVALCIFRDIKVSFSATDRWDDMLVSVSVATRGSVCRRGPATGATPRSPRTRRSRGSGPSRPPPLRRFRSRVRRTR